MLFSTGHGGGLRLIWVPCGPQSLVIVKQPIISEILDSFRVWVHNEWKSLQCPNKDGWSNLYVRVRTSVKRVVTVGWTGIKKELNLNLQFFFSSSNSVCARLHLCVSADEPYHLPFFLHQAEWNCIHEILLVCLYQQRLILLSGSMQGGLRAQWASWRSCFKMCVWKLERSVALAGVSGCQAEQPVPFEGYTGFLLVMEFQKYLGISRGKTRTADRNLLNSLCKSVIMREYSNFTYHLKLTNKCH